MNFHKYQHVEKVGTSSTDGLLDGQCFVFYKLDGTNGSIWVEDGELCAGSRNRKLSLEKDNQGFYKHVLSNEKYKKFFKEFPNSILYGEWLVPHSLKTYRDDAWRDFYVFDMYTNLNGELVPLDYIAYKQFLDKYDINYIPAIASIKNPTYEDLLKCMEKTGEFLVQDGKGNGEGIVVKNYDYKNPYGETIWGKIVSNRFKEEHAKSMGSPSITSSQILEEKIIRDFLTKELIDKEFEKFKIANGGWESKYIPKLFNWIYRTLVIEEIWNMIDRYNKPRINFNILYALTIKKIKQEKSEIF